MSDITVTFKLKGPFDGEAEFIKYIIFADNLNVSL